MEIDNLRVAKLREYLFKIIQELNAQYQQLNVNFLSDDINNYSLDKIPTEIEEEKWIIGFAVCKDVFSFRSRMSYSADVITNIENIGFYETFAKIIKNKNEAGDLPNIEGIETIRCLNAGTMARANTNTAEFDIQIQIEYREGVNNITASI